MPQIPYLNHQSTRVMGAGLGPGPVDVTRGDRAEADIIDTVSNVFESIETDKDANDVANLEAERDEKLLALKLKQQSAAAPGATGYAKDLDSELRALDAEMLWKARSNRAKGMLKQRFDASRSGERMKALEHEVNEGNIFRANSIKDNAQRLGPVLENDPDEFERVGQSQLTAIQALTAPPSQKMALAREMNESLTESAANGLVKRDPVATLGMLRSASDDPRIAGLTPEARDRVEKAALAQILENRIDSVVSAHESGGSRLSVAAYKQAENGLPPELRDELRSRVNAQIAAVRTRKSEEFADQFVAIETDIASDNVGLRTRNKVALLFDVGALSAEERANYEAKIVNSAERRRATLAASEEFRAAVESGMPLDPSSPAHRKGLDAAFAVDTASLPPGSRPWMDTTLAYVGRARMLPRQAESWIRQGMRSPSDKVAAKAAEFLGSVEVQSPEAFAQLDSDTKAFAGVANSLMAGGTDPTKAAETARTLVLTAPKELVEARRAQFSQGKFAHMHTQENALASFVDDSFNPPGFEGAPGIQPALIADMKALTPDFTTQTRLYFEKTGDIALARSLAWKDLTRVYGPTEINGEKVVSAFPVERFGMSASKVREELKSILPKGVDADEVLVVPDGQTMRSVADALGGVEVRPTYKVITRQNDVVLDEYGIPLRYALPSGESLMAEWRASEAKAKAARTASDEKTVNKAKRVRKRLKAAAEISFEEPAFGR